MASDLFNSIRVFLITACVAFGIGTVHTLAIPSTYVSLCKDETIKLTAYIEPPIAYDSVSWFPQLLLTSYNIRNPLFVGSSDQCYLRTLYFKNTIVQEDNFCVFIVDTTDAKFSYNAKICVGNVLSCGIVVNPAVRFSAWNMFPIKGNFLGKSYDTNAVEVRFNDSGIVLLRVNIVTTTNCIVTATIKVFVSPVDPSVICVYGVPVASDPLPQYIKCPTDPISIGVDANIKSVLWNTGDTAHIIQVYKEGKYKATIINKFNCVTETPVVQIINKQSPVLAKTILDVCRNVMIISVPDKYKSYLWNTGERTPSIIPPTRGKYWVMVEDTSFSWSNPTVQNGCFIYSDTIDATTTDNYQYKVVGGNPLCSTDIDTLTSNLPLKRKQWNNGSVSDTLIALQAGLYWFVGIDSNDCTVYSDTINIIDIRPKIMCTNFCNYDTVYVGDTSIRTFTFKNIGTVDAVLTSIPNLPKDVTILTSLPITLHPDESATVILQWAPTSEYNLFTAIFPRFTPCNTLARILIDGTSIRLIKTYSLKIPDYVIKNWDVPLTVNVMRLSANIKYPTTIDCRITWLKDIAWFQPAYNKNFTITNLYTNDTNDSISIDVRITDSGLDPIVGYLKFIPISTTTHFTKINIDNIRVSNPTDNITCSAGSIAQPFVCNPFGVELDTTEINIYPNPIRETSFNIQTNLHNTHFNVYLFNLRGMLIKSWYNTNEFYSYNVQDITSGTYMLRIENEIHTSNSLIQILSGD